MEPTFSAKLISFFAGFSGLTAYGAIFGVLIACGLGVPIPEDITLLAAGVLSSLGKISLPGAIAICLIGVMVGDGFLFFMGRAYGYRVFKLPLFRTYFTETRIHSARERVLNNSKFICFTARFLPGLRAPIFLTSGVLGVSPFTFFALDGGAALISVPAWVIIGWWFGNNIDNALAIAKELQLYLLATVALFITGYILYKRRRAR
ncbi:DedA family protein [Bdellovibrionales bacterium]|nr:DedA family protein [Bdellovibrionales bacterium]